jgi:hypothetical protein
MVLITTVGFSFTAIISANLPTSIDPILSPMERIAALTCMADNKASIAGMPPSTMYPNSFALSPCGNTPASVPKAILTPRLYDFPKFS